MAVSVTAVLPTNHKNNSVAIYVTIYENNDLIRMAVNEQSDLKQG